MEAADEEGDENGRIDFPEFLAVMSKVSDQMIKKSLYQWYQVLTSAGNEAQIRDAFRVFDKDDKGFLTVSQDDKNRINTNKFAKLLLWVKKLGPVNYLGGPTKSW